MLSQQQKTAIRRHLGVPFAGTAQAGRLYGFRFTWFNEDLEYRMNNLQPAEEQLLTGVAMASWRIGPRPTIGDSLDFQITDPGAGLIHIPYVVQSADFALPANNVNPADASPLYSIALNATQTINARMAALSLAYSAVGVMPSDAFAPAFTPPYMAEVLLSGPNASAFTIGAAVTGTTNLQVGLQGSISPVAATLTLNGSQSLYHGYIAILDALAMGMTQADISLWLSKADVASFRRDEIRARRALYREYIEQMTRAIGGASYVEKFGGSSGSVGASA